MYPYLHQDCQETQDQGCECSAQHYQVDTRCKSQELSQFLCTPCSSLPKARHAHSQSPTDWKAGVPSCFHQIRSCLTLFVAWNLASSNSKAPGLVLASVPVLMRYLWSLASFHRLELTASAGLLFWPTHTFCFLFLPCSLQTLAILLPLLPPSLPARF